MAVSSPPSGLCLTAWGGGADPAHRVLKDLEQAPSSPPSGPLPVPFLQRDFCPLSCFAGDSRTMGVPSVGHFNVSIPGGYVFPESDVGLVYTATP